MEDKKLYLVSLPRHGRDFDFEVTTVSDFCKNHGIDDYDAWKSQGGTLDDIMDFTDAKAAADFIADRMELIPDSDIALRIDGLAEFRGDIWSCNQPAMDDQGRLYLYRHDDDGKCIEELMLLPVYVYDENEDFNLHIGWKIEN